MGDERAALQNPVSLASMDLLVGYKLGKGFKFLTVEPYLEGGTGYTWLVEKERKLLTDQLVSVFRLAKESKLILTRVISMLLTIWQV